MASSSAESPLSFERQRHIRYFASVLRQIPSPYMKLDTNRLTLVHFAVHALDMLRIWDDDALLEELQLKPQAIIDWIYRLQLFGGFKGGTFVVDGPYNRPHIAMTYTALCTLFTLGDNLERIDKPAIVQSLQQLQRPDGSFQCVVDGSEHDMRFLYCACCISYMLKDWSGVNVEQAVQYIQNCRSFDGAIALIPGQEGHGGSTFCGVAALVLMEKLDSVLKDEGKRDLIRWCVHRQVGGMQGRPNKAEDTCYSYWIGGTLRLLSQEGGLLYDSLLDQSQLRNFVLTCQSRQLGGFSKVIGAFPDILHSFYSMAWLNLSQRHMTDLDLKPLNCTLGICQERADGFQGPPLL